MAGFRHEASGIIATTDFLAHATRSRFCFRKIAPGFPRFLRHFKIEPDNAVSRGQSQ